jgi:hypothetical protein
VARVHVTRECFAPLEIGGFLSQEAVGGERFENGLRTLRRGQHDAAYTSEGGHKLSACSGGKNRIGWIGD